MKRWMKITSLVLGSVLLLVGVSFWLVTDSRSLVEQKPSMNFQDLQRAQNLWKTYQPSRLDPGRRYIIPLSYRDLDLLGSLAVAQSGWVSDANLGFSQKQQQLAVQLSYPVPVPLIPRYLNGQLLLEIKPGQLPQIQAADVAGIELSEQWLERLQQLFEQKISEQIREAWQDSQVEVAIMDRGVSLAFTWRPDWVDQLPVLTQLDNPELATEAVQQLNQYLAQHPESPLQLESMLPQLLADVDSQEQAVVMLTVLAHYVAGSSVTELFAIDQPEPELRVVHLSGRRDMARHFLFSAMLTARTGPEAAAQYGYLKELSDADHRSTGFSGLDLLANEGGIRFYQRWADMIGDPASKQAFLNLVDQGLLPSKQVLNSLESEPRGYWEQEQIDRLLAGIPAYQPG